jgi:hypothetical protein
MKDRRTDLYSLKQTLPQGAWDIIENNAKSSEPSIAIDKDDRISIPKYQILPH